MGSASSFGYTLHVRSYAPFKTFGGGFEGDNRGASTSPKAKSRIAIQVPMNVRERYMGLPVTSSSGTVWMPLGTSGPTVSGMAKPKVRVWLDRKIRDGLRIGFHFWGGNPVTPKKITPDIDLYVIAQVTLVRRHLNVTAKVRGDAFPNMEMFVTDGGDRARMVMTYETSGDASTGPGQYLPGSGGRHMNAICASFALGSEGQFV